jgi:transketolase
MSSITPLNITSRLAKNPKGAPRYQTTIKDSNGADVTLADPKATRALVALMNQHAVIGGAAAHWGGPAALAEIMSATHSIMFAKENWNESFNFVNDAGHAENGIYALRANYGFDDLNFDSLKLFRSLESKLTGHGEAHLNPQGVLISNGPLGSGLPQAQGLALADKIAGKARTTICVISDGASMEGEAKESFAAIPGLSAKKLLNPFVLLVSDNNTKLSGRIDEDSFSMNPTFKSLETLGWDVRYVEDGHDLEQTYRQVERAVNDTNADSSKPVAVVFKTIKGKGVESTEQSASGGHGYPLKAYDEKLPNFIAEIYDGNAPEEFMTWASEVVASKPAPSEKPASAVKNEKVQPGFARAAIEAAKAGLPVFSLSSDLQGSTGILPFHKEYPTHYVDLGVAESNMVSTAVGMSKQGFIPIVDTFAQFGITKGNLPLIMSGLSQAPVIALFSHIGFQDAADGASHQATTYLAATGAIPHTLSVVVSCSSEAQALMKMAIDKHADDVKNGKQPDSVLFFFGRETHPASYNESVPHQWLKAQVLREGSDVTIVTCGPMVQKSLDAALELEKNGISAEVINHPFANRPDLETLKASLTKTGGKLVTVEDHQVQGGMGSYIGHALSMDGVSFKLKSLGVTGHFGRSAYKANHLYDHHGMGTAAIVETATQMSKS